MPYLCQKFDEQAHNSNGFDCGLEILNRYLQQIPTAHHRKELSRTIVIVEDKVADKILGFYTIAPCSIDHEHLPDDLKPDYPPKTAAFRLAPIAVAKDQQSKGIGKILITDALKKVLSVNKEIGGVGLFVDAKNEAAEFYEKFGFTRISDEKAEFFMPIKTIEKILA